MLGHVNITAANTWTEVPFDPPLATGQSVAVDLYILNRAPLSTQIRLAVGPATAGAITDGHLLEFDTLVPPRASLKHTRLTVLHGQRVWVRASVAPVNAVMFGIVENA